MSISMFSQSRSWWTSSLQSCYLDDDDDIAIDDDEDLAGFKLQGTVAAATGTAQQLQQNHVKTKRQRLNA